MAPINQEAALRAGVNDRLLKWPGTLPVAFFAAYGWNRTEYDEAWYEQAAHQSIWGRSSYQVPFAVGPGTNPCVCMNEEGAVGWPNNQRPPTEGWGANFDFANPGLYAPAKATTGSGAGIGAYGTCDWINQSAFGVTECQADVNSSDTSEMEVQSECISEATETDQTSELCTIATCLPRAELCTGGELNSGTRTDCKSSTPFYSERRGRELENDGSVSPTADELADIKKRRLETESTLPAGFSMSPAPVKRSLSDTSCTSSR